MWLIKETAFISVEKGLLPFSFFQQQKKATLVQKGKKGLKQSQLLKLIWQVLGKKLNEVNKNWKVKYPWY